MKPRLIVAGGLACAALAAGLILSGAGRHVPVPPGVADPALEYYTSAHGDSYAAIDRWAHYGMRAERFIDALQGAGYRCEWDPAHESGTRAGSVRTMLCQKAEQWPLARTLSIRAGFEHSTVDRLAWAKADSVLPADGPSVSAQLAALLRQAGWMEPEALQVEGFRVDKLDTLTRMVAEGLATRGWHESCTGGELAAHCGQAAQDRARSGFAALPVAPLAAGAALDMQGAMERLRFAPVTVRGVDNEQEDSLLVRVANGRMWLDFTSRDLVGNQLAASIEVASEGGRPVRLVTSLGGDSQSVELAGTPRQANDGSMVYLLPKSGADTSRYAVWLNLPDPHHPGTFDRLAQNLPLVDPAFIAPMAKVLLADASGDSGPEERLGLYPALRLIEQQAERIRAMQPERWLPREHSHRLMVEAFHDKPLTRAAWMIASCAGPGEPGTLDRPCVQRFTMADPESAHLVRSEIAQQRLLYFLLPEQHPIRIRLKYLADAFSTGHDGDSVSTGR